MKQIIFLLFILFPSFGICQYKPVTIKGSNGEITQGFVDDKGEKEGEWVSYGPSNIIRGIGYYKDNKKVGYWKTFKNDGTIWSELLYKNGEKVHGKIFGDDGEIVEERCF